MSDLISFDGGSVSDPVYEGATEQELYFIVQVNLLVVGRLQVDDLLDTAEKIYKIQRPSQAILPLGLWRWYYGLSRTATITSLQRLCFHTQSLLRSESLKAAQRKRLRKHLGKSHQGIRKLIETYRTDAATQARLKCLIEETSDLVSDSDVGIGQTKLEKFC
jgi:hypothetical protein